MQRSELRYRSFRGAGSCFLSSEHIRSQQVFKDYPIWYTDLQVHDGLIRSYVVQSIVNVDPWWISNRCLTSKGWYPSEQRSLIHHQYQHVIVTYCPFQLAFAELVEWEGRVCAISHWPQSSDVSGVNKPVKVGHCKCTGHQARVNKQRSSELVYSVSVPSYSSNLQHSLQAIPLWYHHGLNAPKSALASAE